MKTILILSITTLAIFIFIFAAVRIFFVPPSEVTVPSIPSTGNEKALVDIAAGDYPARLTIPSIGVDAAVQKVGRNSKGRMASPSNYTDVGWYSAGTLPGEKGSAIIDGHVDNGLGLKGVFTNLGDVKVGEDILITTEQGTRLKFKVVEIQTYSYQSVPLNRFFNRVDKARLNLITCDGKWVRSDKTYNQRLVIYSELQP